MKAVILTEGGKKFGFGHVTRCMTIAAHLRDRGVEASLIINGGGSLKRIIKDDKYSGEDWLENRKSTIEVLRRCHIAVMDSYNADMSFCRDFISAAGSAYFIDDYNRIDYPGGTVINFGAGAEKINYNQHERVKYILGPQYFPIRKELQNGNFCTPRENVQSILISLGGMDFGTLLGDILDAAAEVYPAARKTVLVPQSLEENVNHRRDSDGTEMLAPTSASEMSELICRSDIALTAAGQTLYELAYKGLPAVAVKIADNQKWNIDGLRHSGSLKYAGRPENPDFQYNLKLCLEQLYDFDVRSEMSASGRSFIDGKGVVRIVNCMIGKSE